MSSDTDLALSTPAAYSSAMKNGRIATLVALASIGCGGSPPAEAAPAPEPAPIVTAEAERDEEADEELEPPTTTYDDATLDAMDRQDLETACHAGSTAACDRLGH